ncbi:MAG: BamA/TamA family outer membrane protein [Luteibaculum sp.]
MEKFLFQNGYFNASVSDTFYYNHKQKGSFLDPLLNPLRNPKKVLVEYHATLREPYVVKSLNYEFLDSRMKEVFNLLDRSELPDLREELYNYKTLDEHRKVISTHFQNSGFYEFKKDFVVYRVDTLKGDHEVHLTARILNPVMTNSRGEKTELVHTRYAVDRIYIYPQYQLFTDQQYSDTSQVRNMTLIYNPPLQINPKLLPTKVFLSSNSYYRLHETRDTYKNLNDMGLYKSVNIDFQAKEPATNNPNEFLDAYIYLSPLKRHSFTLESRLESRAYTGQTEEDQRVTNFNFGVSMNASVSRINAFRNGETLKLSFTGGLEPFFLSDSSSTNNFFNTVEFGPSLQLTFPRFLLPVSQTRFSKSNRPQTTITATYNLLRNDDFFRRATKITFAYSWLETSEKLHRFAPLELSFVNAQLSGPLQNRLEALDNPFLNNTYSDQVIVASAYSFTYRKNSGAPGSDGWYYRGKLEGAGNFLRGIASTFNPNHTSTSRYQIFNITFAQFLALENDLRYYRNNRFGQTLALRLFAAAAKPLDNLNALPFEKSYFAGGSNGIRAWRARSLGPGSYLDTASFGGFLNRIGEIRLEANSEYRFDIISFLEGALFVDVGNIWVFKETANRANTEFKGDFYRDLAVGGGFGLRLDFDFFIIRFDLGFPLRDPSLPLGEKWFFQDKEKYNQLVSRYNEINGLSGAAAIPKYRETPNFNIGIGYPF